MSDTSFNDDFDIDDDDVFTDTTPQRPAKQATKQAAKKPATNGAAPKARGAAGTSGESESDQRAKQRAARAARVEMERQVATAVRVAQLSEADLTKLAGVIRVKDVTAEAVAVALLVGSNNTSAISDVIKLARMDQMSAGAHAAAAEREAQKAMWEVLASVGVAEEKLKPTKVGAALQVASTVAGLSDAQVAELEAFHEMIGG